MSMGFPAPRVDRTQDRSRYMFAVGADEVIAGGDEVDGVYRFGDPDGQIVFSSQHLGASGEGPQDKRATGAHELLHGVQASTPFWASQMASPGSHSWVKEGTAQAVEWTWLKRNYLGGTGPLFLSKYPARNFSDPLHLPDYEQDYSTGYFWAGLGEILGGEPMGYLVRLLESEEWGSGSALTVVDRALRTEHPDGLYHLFPEFAARHLNERNDDVFELDGEFFSLGEKTLAQTVTRHGPLAPVAVHGHDLRVDPLGSPHDLVIEIPDEPHLHLIVDGQRAVGEGAGRNVYETVVDGISESRHRILVVNVAPEAGESQRAEYELKAEVSPRETCDSEVYEARAQFTVAGPEGDIEWEGRRVPSPVGRYVVDFPFEPLAITSRGRTFTYYPAAAATDLSKKKVTLFMQTPSFEEIAAMRSQPGVEVRGEITTAVPEEPGLDEALDGNVGRGGQFVTDSEASLSPAFSFSLASGAAMRGAAVTIRLDEMKPGTYTWDGPTLPYERGVSVRGTEFPIPPLNDDVRVTLDEIKPGVCARGTFSGGVRYDEGQPPVFNVTGSFYVNAPPEPRR